MHQSASLPDHPAHRPRPWAMRALIGLGLAALLTAGLGISLAGLAVAGFETAAFLVLDRLASAARYGAATLASLVLLVVCYRWAWRLTR